MATNPTTPPKVEKLKVVRLLAVLTDVCHALDGTRFNTEASVKHELDDWVQTQLESNILKIDADE